MDVRKVYSVMWSIIRLKSELSPLSKEVLPLT